VADFEVGYKVMCTNQKIHGGRGINAVFYDGHVEFLYGKSCYSGDGEGSNRRMEDDLMSWGITYPRALPQPFPLDPSKKMWEIPGVHGYRRYPAGWCIVHEYDQGFGPKVTQTNKDRFGNNWGTGDCYWDGV
jgi:prepilin-type processing-associated H-X9-DG protein